MSNKTTLTIESVIEFIKEKWQVFGACALIIFVLQLLSSKILLSVFLGLAFSFLLPSDSVKKVVKKVTKKEETKVTKKEE